MIFQDQHLYHYKRKIHLIKVALIQLKKNIDGKKLYAATTQLC